ncbi:simple sugar transport system ATP-binding protein [Desulfohalotomaculum tongense]|uniref:ABC transporter ATP-binding protein n=1 Tax=Desulforadius tongensis TaxID=1216062 RepID=UPI00195EDAA1|nr:ABC transporter ATP-binding protein [Desulforadius tongensis]MBM7855912.1 simple sugar transport system ATP-binding protein [Desulforadius tongensis]
MKQEKTLIEMVNITKRFPGVVANDCVNFDVRAGEVHALLGENGSGKSTLMSILSGLYKPNDGRIFVDGQEVVFKNPRDAIEAGIGMVHQHFKLVDTFTVAENVVLGSKKLGFFLRMDNVEKKLARLSESYGLGVNPSAKVWQLSVGERQRVEIVKMLYRGSRVLILDEPTAVLTPQEARELFATLKKMTARGHAVILITHKMQEVMEVADRVTVLRRGKSVATINRSEVTPRDLANLMMGQDFVGGVKREKGNIGRTVLEMTGVNAEGEGHRPSLNNISLSIASGEIMGIVGVAGNGRRELAEVIVGMRKISSGRIRVDGKDTANKSPRELIDMGVSYIPDDRLGTGLVPSLDAVDNLIMKSYKKPALGKGLFINLGRARAYAEKLVDEFGVKLTSIHAPVSLLSGGNQQRLLLARELAENPRLVVAVFPSRGLDIAAAEAVHKLLLEQASRGAAVMLISEDLDEIFKLCHRVGVLYKGCLMGDIPIEEASAEQIGLMMLGASKSEVKAS